MTRHPRRIRHVVLTACAVTALGILAPTAASAALTDHGGAARHDGDATDQVRSSIIDAPAKNVILIIGDGMGDSEITIARNYAHGAAGELPGIDALPLTGSYSTYSLHRGGDDHGKPNYVPDSAATGTAWATGTKSYNGAISVDLDSQAHDTVLELAKANGLRTGNVSTAEIQDATPAVQQAHVDHRKCYGPESVEQCGADALDRGGAGSISEQILDSRADVVLGGGTASFEQVARAGQWEGRTLFEQAEQRGYQVVTSAEELGQVDSADQSAPLLGLFTPGNMPTRFSSSVAVPGGNPDAPITCEVNPERLPEELSLGAMTEKAIDLLDAPESDEGFFLQVEGASIDKRNHAADACGQIGETIDLDEAVRAALDFAEQDGETLVIVTADHAHTSQIVGSVPDHTIGNSLVTADGSVMHVAYGTAPTGGSQQHTGAQVPVAAYGPGAANVVGLTDQTDTFFTVLRTLGLNADLGELSADAAIGVPSEAVAPGAPFEVTGAGFAGDRQVRVTIDGQDVGAVDVIDGRVLATAEAPAETGAITVQLTGVQSGVSVEGAIEIAEATGGDGGAGGDDGAEGDGGAAEGGDDGAAAQGDDDAAGAGAGGSGVSAGGNGLPVTGMQITSVLLLAAGLTAAGLLVRSRRRGAGAA